MAIATKCPHCGGRLPRHDDEGMARCEFCGTESRVAIPRPREQQPAGGQGAPRSKGRKGNKRASKPKTSSLVPIAVVLVSLAGTAALALYLRTQPTEAAGYTIATMPKKKTGWFTLNLRSIDVIPSRHDAIANYEWVLRFAQAWSPDAVLTALVLTVRADGLAIDAPLAEYTFVSPKNMQARELMGAAPDAPHAGLLINVLPTSASAFISPHPVGRPGPQPVQLECSFEQIMSAARTSGLPLEDLPKHQLRLEHRGEHWSWRISFGKIYVDAESCAVVGPL